MTDKIVTYADLNALRALRSDCSEFEKDEQRLLDRLIAAAEADAPPLPEGWVVYADSEDGQRVFWHSSGDLSIYKDAGLWSSDRGDLARCTPLRPTITEAEFEAAVATLEDRFVQTSRGITRDMFKAAGIEVAL